MVRVFVSSIDDDVSAVTSSTESSCDERIEYSKNFFFLLVVVNVRRKFVAIFQEKKFKQNSPSFTSFSNDFSRRWRESQNREQKKKKKPLFFSKKAVQSKKSCPIIA